jgi:hypothetical protein
MAPQLRPAIRRNPNVHAGSGGAPRSTLWAPPCFFPHFFSSQRPTTQGGRPGSASHTAARGTTVRATYASSSSAHRRAAPPPGRAAPQPGRGATVGATNASGSSAPVSEPWSSAIPVFNPTTQPGAPSSRPTAPPLSVAIPASKPHREGRKDQPLGARMRRARFSFRDRDAPTTGADWGRTSRHMAGRGPASRRWTACIHAALTTNGTTMEPLRPCARLNPPKQGRNGAEDLPFRRTKEVRCGDIGHGAALTGRRRLRRVAARRCRAASAAP